MNDAIRTAARALVILGLALASLALDFAAGWPIMPAKVFIAAALWAYLAVGDGRGPMASRPWPLWRSVPLWAVVLVATLAICALPLP
jgi:hypothetical protein